MLNSDEFVRYQPTIHRIQSHDGSSDQNEKVQQGWKFKKSGILTSSKSEFKDYNWFRRLDRSYFFWPVRPLEKHRIENSLWDAAGRFSPSAPPMISNVLSQRDRRYVSPFFFESTEKNTTFSAHQRIDTFTGFYYAYLYTHASGTGRSCCVPVFLHLYSSKRFPFIHGTYVSDSKLAMKSFNAFRPEIAIISFISTTSESTCKLTSESRWNCW